MIIVLTFIINMVKNKIKKNNKIFNNKKIIINEHYIFDNIYYNGHIDNNH